ncbi:MAG: calcium-binding protein, partial [Sodalinema sp.]|uniref:calcium-binding protein n=1 Tax=Sodalinema sp. TaxID=3080550 RepID=UPI00396F46A8
QEDFNTLGDGLPSGWAIYTDATSSSLGTLINFNSDPKSWNNTAGGFRNVASANSEVDEGDAASKQKQVSDRALGIRQTEDFGDPGAAFVLSLANTEGFQDFQLSLEAQMLSIKKRSTSWTIDYRIGTESDFLPLGTYDDPEEWGVTQLTTGSELLDFGDAIDNQSKLVQIRIVALSDSTNSNYRDTVAIDNFSLNYSPVEDTSDPDELAPRVLAIQRPDTIDESTTEETIIYEVSFSEAVNEVDVADFSLTTTGTATADIASVSAESGTMIEVTLEGVDGDGTLRLDVPDTATIVNDAGVALTEAFEAGDRYRIEDPTQDNETGDSDSDSDDSDAEPQPDPEADSDSDDSDAEPQPDPEADSDSDSDDSEADVEPEPEPTANRSSRRLINQLILGSGTEPETLIGGDGNDTIAAFDYDDVIFAQGGDNLLFGNKGNDRIYSRDGDDTLFGGQDNDLLIGGPGDTVLSGDFGNDTLTGGGGNNLFILRPQSSYDVITDFNPDRDRLGLSHGLTSEDLTWTQQGNHTLIQVDRSGRAIATLQNTAADLLDPSQMLPISYPGLE